MSHIIQIDFQRRRFVSQEITLLRLDLPTDRQRAERRHGLDGWVSSHCPCTKCRAFFAAHTVPKIEQGHDPKGAA